MPHPRKSMLIREETASDRGGVRAVTLKAFSGSPWGYNGECELIDAIRSGRKRHLSLVASDHGEIIGHVLFTPVVISESGQDIHGMGLGPLSVLPEFQRRGIGSSLVGSGLNRLKDDGFPFIVVVGRPDYYARFGFERASEYRVVHGFDGIPQECFLIRPLSTAKLPDFRGTATAHYAAEFGPQYESAASPDPKQRPE